MRKKGFTLVELLVVIAIIALLMGLLMPALARVRQIAYRMVCGTNLAGIGKAMVVYAHDQNGDYPVAGEPRDGWSTDGEVDWWDDRTAGNDDPTIGACYYLLIKYTEATVKQFICRGDSGSKVLKLSDYEPVVSKEDVDAWDFGTQPGIHCSYAYHMPFVFTGCGGSGDSFPMSTTNSPASPVCADRNPYIDKNAEGSDSAAGGYVDGQLAPDEVAPTWGPLSPGAPDGYLDYDKTSNAAAHQREGQNVLYNDVSVRFELHPNCGIADDNIYKKWSVCDNPSDEDKQLGTTDTGGTRHRTGGTGDEKGPASEADAFLVNEHQDSGSAP